MGQSVTLGGLNEGPLTAPLQKFGVLPERAKLGPSTNTHVAASEVDANDLLFCWVNSISHRPLMACDQLVGEMP
jgi:hypothetical protein